MCRNKTNDQDKKNDLINRDIRKAQRELEREVKLLLLGAGDSGKSTIAKQMKILHLNGFSEQELLVYKPVIVSNTLQSLKALIIAAQRFGYVFLPQNQPLCDTYANINPIKVEFSPAIAAEIKQLWVDPSIQAAFQRQNEFQLPGVAEYCFMHIDRISHPSYIPTTEDALRCRARTTGIIETVFTVDNLTFRMVDVGGQRSERKKWVHCFQDVTALIFVVALNEYDMKLFEDEAVNRMHESVELFDEICNSEWFERTSIIQFLNKRDLFEEKIKRVDLRVCFAEYNGGANFENGWKFIRDKFLSLNRNPGQKHIYTHLTCATDTESIRVVFNAVKDITLTANLAQANLIH